MPETSVELDDLTAVYETAFAMTDGPARLQRKAAMRVGDLGRRELPNPLAGLKERGVGEPTAIEGFHKPEAWYDGRQIVVRIKPVEGAAAYRVYVAAYESGAGAQVMAKGTAPVIQVNKLRPEFPLYFAATYLDAKKKESKPSAVRRVLLKDDFPNK